MQRKLPPLKALRVFEATARLESITKAADELHVTHGAVSQQIKILEEYFQKSLFLRANGKISLNDHGKKLLPVTSEALNSLENITTELFEDVDTDALTINLTAAFASHWLVSRLNDFQCKFPHITLRLLPSASFGGFKQVEADVAIRWGKPQSCDVEMVKLFDVDTFVACSPGLLNENTPLNQPLDIRHHTLIHDDDGSAWQAWLDQAKVENIDLDTGHFFADSALALQAAIDGQGIIAAGSILASKDLDAGNLIIPFDVFLRNRNAYYLSYPKKTENRQSIKIFRDWIIDQAETHSKNRVSLERYIPKI